MSSLFWAEMLLLVFVIVGGGVYSLWVGKGTTPERAPALKGLNLPEGSIRAMLALVSVGSFVLVLVLGPSVETVAEHFDTIVTAFGTLTGAIMGFYFGSRGAGRV